MDFTYDITMFREVFETQFTWLGGFARNVRRFGDKTALFDPATGRSWSYEALNAVCDRLANALQRDGVTRSDVVMYQLPNSPAFAFCYIAPQKLGAINSPANFNLAPVETAKILEHNHPKVFVFDAEFRATAEAALRLSAYRPKRVLMVAGADDAPPAPGVTLFSDYLAAAPDGPVQMAHTPHIYDEVTRLYTSGTTSLPKGVPLNNVNEVLSAHDVMMNFPLNSTDRTMNMTPWFHRGGLHAGGLTPTFYAGGEVVILRSFNPRLCLEYTEKYKVTFLIGVPAVLSMLANTQERRGYDLSCLRGIVTMGAPLEEAACNRFHQVLTPNLFNGYGTTETFWNTFLRPYELPEMAGSAGRACTDDEVRVVRVFNDRRAEPEELVPEDSQTVGQIIIKSPSKSACSYYHNEEMTHQKFYQGWLYTGDLATWDDNQFITVCGRSDDMIICSGENIFPAQIEEVLNSHPKVRECIVTAVPDKTRGQAVAAYIIPSDPTITVAEMIDFCNHSPVLSPYKRPRYYRFVEALPMTATGKKQHFKIKQQAAEDLKNGLLRRS
ncbi:MAG: AMP-binding protein [Oscillospiraceae bacterium]|nr:AMP-binding protein [Oscillospiraceae bacterium]